MKNTPGIVPRFPAGCLADQVSAPEENEAAAEPSQLYSHRPGSTLTPFNFPRAARQLESPVRGRHISNSTWVLRNIPMEWLGQTFVPLLIEFAVGSSAEVGISNDFTNAC